MGKLLDNEIFKRSRNLQVFAIVFLLIITPCFSATVFKTQTDKLKDFDKMTDKDKTKAIYQECLVANNKITMSTGGTEYITNDPARVFARLLDGNSRPINIASCNVTVYYPNNTKLFNNVPLTFLEKGIYYYDFTTPNITGNYITIFDCIEPSIPFTQNRTIGVEIGAGYPTFYDDFPFDNMANVTINSAWIYYSVTGGGGGASVTYYFNGQTIGTALGVAESLNVTLYQGNFTGGESQQYAVQRTALTSMINSVTLFVNYTWNDPQQLIRGQDEVHVTDINSGVSSQIENIPSNVWNFTTRNLTYYPNVTADVNYTYFNQQFNQTWFNQQTIYNFVQTMNTTMVTFQELVKPQVQDIWDYVQEVINSLQGIIIS